VDAHSAIRGGELLRSRFGAISLLSGILLATIPASAQGYPKASSAPPIVLILLENKDYSTVSSNYADIPFLQDFEMRGLRFTDYTEGDDTGPSLPDYLQLASGSGCGAVSDTVSPGEFGGEQGCPTTVWNQLDQASVSWGIYMDAMPEACSDRTFYANVALDEPYALKHNPAVPFASVWSDQTLCQAHVLPGVPDATALPAVSFVVPGLCDDLHGSKSTAWTDCYPGTSGLYHRADTWLRNVVPPLVDAGADVIITFDESGLLYAAEQGPGVKPGAIDPTPYTHYSVLAAIESGYGLSLLGGAQTATPIPLGHP
jgi:phosphoesterase family protein